MTKKQRKIVVIGGGTGTYTVLTGLRDYPVDLTAIVSMFDSGGSSGRLRDEFGILPPGDIRQALLALSKLPVDKLILRQLLDYRFKNGVGLRGHSFGNLLLTALNEITGRADLAIEEAAKILNVKGRVLPVSLTDAHLCARLEDGTIIKGETNIDIRRVRPELKILDLFLDPPAKIFLGAKKAILEADLIVLGPGDLYTSTIPNLLVEGVCRAIAKSKAEVFYVCNLMIKYGETDNFAVSDFIKEIKRYLDPAAKKLKKVLVNKPGRIPKEVLLRYAQEKSFPVKYDKKNCQNLGVEIVLLPLAGSGQLWRHDPKKLARALVNLVN
ncbi:MAG: gluconeogenesis factor YvcK family protein [Microgenomates group bacterium]